MLKICQLFVQAMVSSFKRKYERSPYVTNLLSLPHPSWQTFKMQ
jgi:hypothetical protein